MMLCGNPTPGRVLWFMLLLTLFGGAAPAWGTPVTVFFDGAYLSGEHKGLDGSNLPAGVPQLSMGVYTTTGSLDVVHQSADGTVVGGGVAPNEVTSHWVVENTYGAFPAQVYLLFVTALNHSDSGFTTTYNTDFTDEVDEDHDRGGMVIDPATGWVIVDTFDAQLGMLHYVGIPLDFANAGSDCGGVTLAVGQACVDVTYFLENPGAQVFDNGSENILVLPELQILMGVVPEPSTGALLALGLGVLAARRRGV